MSIVSTASLSFRDINNSTEHLAPWTTLVHLNDQVEPVFRCMHASRVNYGKP